MVDKSGVSSQRSTSKIFDTEGGKSKSNTIEIPSITLPRGGGAIKGIDEKFTVNAVNGTSSLSFPLPFAESRGFSPSLTLSYNSGNGNGIFGLGWSINLPSIKRKTDNGLPRYLDESDSDTFLFSEAEDLVPKFKLKLDGSLKTDSNGDYIIDEKDSSDGNYIIRFYYPRIEGLFSHIERWYSKDSSEIRWRVISKENVTTLFGWTPDSRIADPNDSTRIYEWLPEFAFDDKGNCQEYIYREETIEKFPKDLISNTNRFRSNKLTYTNRYLEKIYYGNKNPYKRFNDPRPPLSDYLFKTQLDYGEYNIDDPENFNTWDFRNDAFSDYKPGFEIRTTRLCKRVLQFNHFTGTDEYDGIVRSLNFSYDTATQNGFTFLKSIASYGYIKKGGTYSKKALPPLEFSYQPHEWNNEIKSVSPEDLTHAPSGLESGSYQFTDLYNEGLSGILTEQTGEWYYKRNLGDGHFENARLVGPKPAVVGQGAKWRLADLDADGAKQAVVMDNLANGYYELNDKEEWLAFKAFNDQPNIDFADSNTRLLDLTGDGKADVVITEDNVITWYASEGKNGYATASKTPKPFDEELGPHVLFADSSQSIYLADMSGDGLTDIVRIRNGETCYWPNLGYGNFGAKVAMENAPVFDYSEAFNPSYLQLADIDGSGTTDIIYLGKNKFSCWKNLNGNGFGTNPFELDPFPEIHPFSNITVADLLGNGVACIVWSSTLPKDADNHIKYIDLMNSKKPHLMVSYKNNLGKEVYLEYTPSTKFYLDDKKAGKPWVTKLHFPVHCLSKKTIEDKVSGYRFVTAYKYHHGYFDHSEKEFGGFGMVEQIDSETFEHWVKGNSNNIVEEPLHQEPVITRSWKHTGAFLGKDRILNQFKEDFWYNEMERIGFTVNHHEKSLPDAYLIAAPGIGQNLILNLSGDEWQEAIRACKGMMLRAETFAKDAVKFGNTDMARKRELTPFWVSSHNCVIELIQPKGQNTHAVFVVKESESITYHYERNAEDPRIAHNLNIKLDRYGNILESASVVYPRGVPNSSLPAETQQEQSKTTIIYTENQFTNDVILEDIYRLRLPSESRTFELKGVTKSGTFYKPTDFDNILSDGKSESVHYHEIDRPLTQGKAQRRLIEHLRSTYYRNNLSGALPLHQLESLALPFENYQLAYTPELVSDIFGTRVNDTIILEGKFTHSEEDNNWWIRSGTTQFITGAETAGHAQNRFYVPISFTDPYGAVTKVSYYGSYHLMIEETEDALGNKVSVEQFNFRTLSPQKMKDINGNFTETVSDELGLVKAVAIMGKGQQADEIAGINEATNSTETTLTNNFFNLAKTAEGVTDSDGLRNISRQLLNHSSIRFVYDLDRYQTSGKPVAVAAISRETHYRKLDSNTESKVQLAFEYSNGLGEVCMKKVQAEPGKAKKVTVNPGNTIAVSEIDTSSLNPKHLRWIGNGKTIRNNKGNVVKQYEPYFSVCNEFEDFEELTEVGVVTVFEYDSVGRLTKTQLPDGTFLKTEFSSWEQRDYDANDTLLDSSWYQKRSNNLIDAQLIAEGKDPLKEKAAADQSAKHANTPATLHFDTLGRPVLAVEHNMNIQNNTDVFYYTKTRLDAEGNLRTVTDDRQNLVMSYKYDMLGNMVYQNSMDAGQRWLLTNILGSPLRTWDERNHEMQYFYDIAQRPTHSKVIGGDGIAPLDHVFERVIYGESLLTPNRSNEATLQGKNVLGQVIKHFDTGGLIDTPEYDFKGQPVSVNRKLFKKYKEVTNWKDANLAADLEGDDFIFSTETDALGRITRQTAPDQSIITPSYNETGLLKGEKVNHFDVTNNAYQGEKDYIIDIRYNEKGQRNKIIYGNNVSTNFYFDKETFRLKRLESKRLNGDPLQDWYYTYDPSGNITHIEDKNIPVVFYNNQKVAGVSEYTYDALYRLVEAKGRENGTTLNFGTCDNWDDKPFRHALNPGDPMAIRNYTEKYQYDSVGNIKEMKHLAAGGNWTRSYTYETNNNRLKSTGIGDINNPINYTKYKHHARHGFLEELPHLETIHWNFKEEVVLTSRQHCTDDNIPVITYYQYDGEGQRIRKITENQTVAGGNPTKKEERVYVSGYERYKKYSIPNAGLERVSLSLMDQGHRFVMVETRNNVDDGTEKQLIRYQLHNHLGSASLELDGSSIARVISYEEYQPFGTTAYQARNTAIKSVAKRYRYTGMERDEETGLEYHKARYYLPWLGRWLSSDPIGIKVGLNLFEYAHNNSINFSDSQGQASEGVQPKTDWEKERRRHTRKKSRDLKKAQKSSLTLDPVQKRIQDEMKSGSRKRTPIQGHHHFDINEAKRLEAAGKTVDPKVVGDPNRMTSLYSEVDEKMKGSLDGKDLTHHNVAAEIDKIEKAKVPDTSAGRLSAADASKSRLPGTVDMEARAKMDWTPSTPKGPPVDPKTGIVIKESKTTKALQWVGDKFEKLTKNKKLVERLKKFGKNVAEIGAKRGAKLVPFLGTAAGAASVVTAPNVYEGYIEAVGASELPIAAQVADVSLIVQDVGWELKDLIDPDQKAEQWAHENLGWLGF